MWYIKLDLTKKIVKDMKRVDRACSDLKEKIPSMSEIKIEGKHY